MRSVFRHSAASRPNTGWLVLLLLLAVLVPSACLMWFMNQAVRNEKLAVRQQLTEVYRGTIALAQDHLDAWRTETLRTAGTNQSSGADLYAAIVRAGLADTAICFDAASNVVYPAPERGAVADPAAKALQTQVRALNHAGDKAAAVELIIDSVNRGALAGAADDEGRLVLPDLELLALELAPTNAALLAGLQTQLNDYHNAMPAPQRRFLMRRLSALFPGRAAFPTLGAEDLAASYLEAGSSLPGVWRLPSGDGRAWMLFRVETLQARLREIVPAQAVPAGASLMLVAPNSEKRSWALALPAGENFPGWQLALALKDGGAFDAAARAQIASYVWISALTMAAVAALAALGAGFIRRQAAVARLRSDLLANVTHELKTPLSSMRLLVDTLLQSQPIREETARQYLQLIATENVRLSRLIDNFLAFSRIERNKQVFDFARIPSGSLAQRAAAAVRDRFTAAGCRFELREVPGLPPVEADADAMVTVLLNLLDNAWKYSGEDKQITLSAFAEDGNVVFAVQDNGIGLSPRETKRIFKRFYQVDQRLARTGGGCGLGLSIVQYIVQAHHGAVRVESEPGRGSTFIVTLPGVPL